MMKRRKREGRRRTGKEIEKIKIKNWLRLFFGGVKINLKNKNENKKIIAQES